MKLLRLQDSDTAGMPDLERKRGPERRNPAARVLIHALVKDDVFDVDLIPIPLYNSCEVPS